MGVLLPWTRGLLLHLPADPGESDPSASAPHVHDASVGENSAPDDDEPHAASRSTARSAFDEVLVAAYGVVRTLVLPVLRLLDGVQRVAKALAACVGWIKAIFGFRGD